ncbi:ArsR/SmtB family transcription factor [Cohnella sp. GCM10012308]|uniref:ArsR/SmtB family transcription factor n=1 Tax=Cohnella sp. GCM10012308 TaxID=3317329 RepID=UPI00360CA001
MGQPLPQHDVYQAIADPSRRRLLRLLTQGEQPLSALSGQFEMSRTAVSKHLRVLREAGLVTERRAGRETRYAFRPEPLTELKDWLSYFEQFWDNKLAMLKHLVEEQDNDA